MCYSWEMPRRVKRSTNEARNDANASNAFATMAERGEWSEIHRRLLQKNQSGKLSGAELERLGEAAYMLGREDEFVRAYERAFDKHLEIGDERAAALCGFWIGLTLIFRGAFGQGSGWLARADRLLENHEPECAERGYLLLPKVEQYLAAGDSESGYMHAKGAAEIGLQCDDKDLFAMARHLQGRIKVEGGDFAGGFEMLDEVMVSVTSDHLSPIVTGLVYCSVIEICQNFHATNRAREWTSALAGWCAKQPDIVAFTGRCMIHRAEILILDGHWDEAGREAGAASIRLQGGPVKHHAGPALYQEGEVFRLRGQIDAADAAYRAASALGFDPQPGLALLRLEQGRGQSALSAIRRALQSVEDTAARLRLLPAAVEITLAAGSADDARALCDTLQDYAKRYASDAILAAAAEATARVLIHEEKAGGSLPFVRRAADILWELQAPYRLARVRMLTARAYIGIGDIEGAHTELDEAINVFRELGAQPDEVRASKLMTELSKSGNETLTPRQAQVLRLIAAGLTNPAIAEELGLSQRTIDRHVSDILTRLNVPTRAAAIAYAFEHSLIGTNGSG